MVTGLIVCAVLSVYDGDTISVTCEIWPKFEVSTSVRINGIDTPEIRRSKCTEEKELAIVARDRVRELVGSHISITNVKLGKFAGRVVADVYANGANIGKLLIEENLAYEYHGGKRRGWC